jgi:hypothetical protein
MTAGQAKAERRVHRPVKLRLRATPLVVLVLVALVCLASGAGAEASPTWLASNKLSSAGQNGEKPQVSVDGEGDALAAWERLGAFEVSTRPAGGASWQPAVTVSGSKEQASYPQVAIDSHGDGFAVWLGLEGGEYSIDASTRAGLGGSWQTPVTLGKLGAMIVMEPRPDLAVDAQGDAVAVWQRASGAKVIVESSSRPGGGSWQTSETLSEEGEGLHPAEVGIDAAGAATAVWEEKNASVLIDAASKVPGGKWQPGTAISKPGANANEPRVAVNARGEAVALWERFGGEEELIEAAFEPSVSAGWAGSVALTKPEASKGEPAGQQVAIDGQGDAVATWSRTNANRDVVEAAVGRGATSTWQAPVALSGLGANVEEAPKVAANAQGEAIVVWERSDGTNEIVEAATGQASSGVWTAAVPLSVKGQNAQEQQIYLDAEGNAAAVWRRFDGTDYISEAAGFDAAGPRLSGLAIPASATVGQQLAFMISPFDVWSALAATSWSFGDGTSQPGTSVSHAYATPGRYTVTVASNDALGNQTLASGQVLVSAVAAALAPKIARLSLSHSRFRVSKHATALSAKTRLPLGTSFRFSLSEASAVRIVFTRSANGLRRGKHCLAPSATLRRHHAKRCKRTLQKGVLTRTKESAGADSIAFSGRLGSKPLAKGTYKATLTATAAGLKSVPASVSLTILP